jgi:hypothetical protein
MTEATDIEWIHRWSLKPMPGWTEERLAAEVRKRELKSLRAAKTSKNNSDYTCLSCGKDGGRHVYRWGVAYAGPKNDTLFGLERWYTTMCKECIEKEITRWLELNE